MAFDVGTAVGYLDLDTSGFTKGFARARADMKIFSDENATLNDKLAATGSIMKSVGSTMTKYVTLPLVGIGAVAVTTAAGFESAMSQVQAVSGASGEDFDALKDKALEMGAKTKFSASEAAEAMNYMAMAGWKTGDMLAGIEGIMNLAAASGEDLATTSDIVTDALTAFGLTAADSGDFANILAAASANANTNVSMLGESFKYVAPVAGALGYEVEDTAIALGLMANAGIKGSQGGTVLRASLTRMIKPTKDAAEVMEAYGLSLTNTDGSMKELGDVMDMLRSNLGGLTEAEQAQVAATLFGQEAMSGMLAIINASEKDYEELTEAIYGSKDAAQTMADTMQDNLAGQLTILKSTLEGIAISFGDILLPMIKKVVEGLQGFASWINGLSDSQKEFIANALLMAAAIGPVLLILGKLVNGILGLKKGLSVIGPAFTAIKAALAAAGVTFGTVIAVIAAVVAAVIALKAAWDTNFGGIREKTAEIGASIQDMFTNLISMLQSWGNFFLSLWKSDWMGIQTIFTTLWKRVEVLFSKGLDILNEVFQLFSNVFAGDWSAVWQNIQNIFTGVVEYLALLFATGLDALLDLLQNIGTALWEKAAAAFNNIKSAFSEVWADIMAWFERAKEDPVGAIEGIASDLYEAGKTIIGDLYDGLVEAWEKVKKWASQIADWLKEILSVSADVTVTTTTNHNGGGGSFASGLDYVPRDMVVKVHEGESIRTKQQTREGTAGYEGRNVFNFYSPKPIDELEAAKQFKRAQRDLAEGF